MAAISRLRELRMQRKLSIADVARAAEVSEHYVSFMETGDRVSFTRSSKEDIRIFKVANRRNFFIQQVY